MAWWDDLWSFISPAVDVGKQVVSTAVDFAKENPTLTGAGLGLITGGGTGNYGEANLRNTLGGAALGYAAGQAYQAMSPSAGLDTTGVSTPSAPPTAGVGSANVAPGVSVSTPSVVAAPGGGGDFGLRTETLQAAGSELNPRGRNPYTFDYTPPASITTGVSSGPSAVGVSNAGSAGPLSGAAWNNAGGAAAAAGSSPVLDKLNAGLQTIRDTSKQYGDVVGLGIKGYSAYQGMEQGRKADEYMQQQARLRQEAMDQNKAIVDKQNALTQQRADEYLAIDPQREAAKAYSTVMGRQSQAANQLEATELSKGYSAQTAAANKRRAMLGAATGASTAAEAARAAREGTRMAGLNSIRYGMYDTPSLDQGYYNAVANSGKAETEGAVKFLDDLTGLQTSKAKDQVKPDQYTKVGNQ